MRITYVGPYRAVDVPSLGMSATRDVPIEVPGDIAARLLRQPANWAEAAPEKPESKSKPAKSTTTEEGD